ncbi:hypothetical protein T10_5660 [Trichinella papuae]|uniref:Uncharacterized protein n=1 Tax=Trichinella papuae TaxID=268474 RepID=A0A0V1NA29_9BILA|nr:hypothetical protein T10_5660 [Trichinella papuae]
MTPKGKSDICLNLRQDDKADVSPISTTEYIPKSTQLTRRNVYNCHLQENKATFNSKAYSSCSSINS